MLVIKASPDLAKTGIILSAAENLLEHIEKGKL